MRFIIACLSCRAERHGARYWRHAEPCLIEPRHADARCRVLLDLPRRVTRRLPEQVVGHGRCVTIR